MSDSCLVLFFSQPDVAKIARMQSIDPEDLPQSYRTNNEEENLVLEYVENFRRQFVQLYPERKELLMCPRNECGVEKFICTTVRPTQLEYNELYDLEVRISTQHVVRGLLILRGEGACFICAHCATFNTNY
jgi:hypothetical protein